MNTVTIERKKYVLIPMKEYENLRKRAALKTKPARKLSLEDGQKLAHRLIDKWSQDE